MKLLMTAIERARDKFPADMSDEDLAEIAVKIQGHVDAASKILASVMTADVQRILDSHIAGDCDNDEMREAFEALLESWDHDAASNSVVGRIIKNAKAGAKSVIHKIRGIVQTVRESTAGIVQRAIGHTGVRMHDEPAWELVRLYPREVPRGSPESHSMGWEERWDQLGVAKPGGRLIALKGADVWPSLGDPANFKDAIGVDHPPFAYNSGKGWRGVPRQECIELGLIAA